MYEIVFYALLAEGDAAVEMVRRRRRGRRRRQQEMMHTSPPPPGRVHTRVSDCRGGAISQSGDIFYLFILFYFYNFREGLRAQVPAEGNKPGLGVRVGGLIIKKRKEKIATEKKRLT